MILNNSKALSRELLPTAKGSFNNADFPVSRSVPQLLFLIRRVTSRYTFHFYSTSTPKLPPPRYVFTSAFIPVDSSAVYQKHRSRLSVLAFFQKNRSFSEPYLPKASIM